MPLPSTPAELSSGLAASAAPLRTSPYRRIRLREQLLVGCRPIAVLMHAGRTLRLAGPSGQPRGLGAGTLRTG
jgi:hypothetical protein